MAANNRKYSPSADLIPIGGVAESVNVSSKTFLRWLNNGKLGIPQPILINGRRYFRRSEIEGWKDLLFRQRDNVAA